MDRERFLGCLVGLAAVPLAGCGGTTEPEVERERPEVFKPLSEWRALLGAAAYGVMFEGATETPGTSPLNGEYRPGTYICAACYVPLFSSAAKYDSGTGWPSFWEAFDGRFVLEPDYLLSVPRTEYHCKRCGGHHGHVFDDGPPPTGKRWCNNGLALLFVLQGDPLPELRT
jgi:peptide-methionine (R)-S-oxide reductase